MELVVISSGNETPGEIDEVTRMFELGLKYFHIRKTHLSKRDLKEYITSFPSEYRSRMILHNHHDLAFKLKLGGIHISKRHRRKGRIYRWRVRFERFKNPNLIITRTFHKLTDIQNDRRRFSYAFLSPVFDSITHATLSGGFSKRALNIVNSSSKYPIFAVGGVTVERLPDIAQLGFSGAALHGSIWAEGGSPAHIFKAAADVAKTLEVKKAPKK